MGENRPSECEYQMIKTNIDFDEIFEELYKIQQETHDMNTFDQIGELMEKIDRRYE